MSLDAPRLSAADLHDLPGRRPVVASEVAFTGKVWDVRRDHVDLGGGSVVTRDVVEHDGAVLVLAVREDRGGPEVLLIRQYRHPVAAEDWELPAGLLDVEGEDPLQAARRELAEEADLRAEHWEQLLSFTPSPGSLGEVITAFVATGLSEVPAGERHVREHEEAGMPVGWVRVPDVVAAVLGGQVRNGPMIVGVLALAARLH
ncbi:ADP-ribose pyrophosphatase [Ornithinimicrobium sp. CNJ-824]|uniref:NUDIX domain-containing protein n=1 Tax=Ornithinimicrobium sp. CNJ-824 TaxID=1904966 RepID=UPI00095F6FB2|nr:NUDIX hydrolase [Ornithinimicrobium sp. CNJ-824]OLT19791.1 ADP-ribose pyrophosphatase [Ornithinimicrobium sp. CNJ-824]